MRHITKRAIIISTIFMIFPITVNADCYSDFKDDEKKFESSYEYNKNTDDFTIKLTNPNFNKYTYKYKSKEDLEKASNFTEGNTLYVTISNYKGNEFTYGVIGNNGECTNKTLKEEKISLKKYNPYADSPLCVGYEDFVLCQKEYDQLIDEEEFKSRLETYKKSKLEETQSNNVINNNTNKNNNTNVGSNENKESEKNSIIDTVLNFIKENVVLVIASVVIFVGLIIGIIIHIKKVIKSRRLE